MDRQRPPGERGRLRLWATATGVGACVLLAVAVYMSAQAVELHRNGLQVIGEVVEPGTAGEAGSAAQVRFTHPVTGEDITFGGGVGGLLGGGGNEVGAPVRILVDQQNPDRYEINSFFNLAVLPGFAGVGAIVLTVTAVAVWRRSQDDALRSG